MSVWLIILLAGLGSYLFRISMVVLADRIELPAWLTRASAFVAPAAFAALAAGGIAAHLTGTGMLDAVPVIGALAAAVVAVRLTGKPVFAIVAGMPALWLLTALVGV